MDIVSCGHYYAITFSYGHAIIKYNKKKLQNRNVTAKNWNAVEYVHYFNNKSAIPNRLRNEYGIL